MPTVGSAKAWAIQELKKAKDKAPALSADLLLAFFLHWERVRVLSHPEDPISEESWAQFQDLVQRRARGEPLQYITGEKEFYGLTFRTKPGALIPRPETEILVEKAIELMRQRLPSRTRFLDIGTGSGCIAISIAREVPVSAGWAVDISGEALEVARENATRHGVARRILMIRSNLFECFSPAPLFDFIFCNPPYVALRDCDSLPPEVRDYEPHLALFGGESGLDFYCALIPEAPSRIVSGGYLLLELGAGQAEPVRRLIENEGLLVETILNDLQGIPRCLIAQKTGGANNG
jgi:release factor glutamine methyltransferase